MTVGQRVRNASGKRHIVRWILAGVFILLIAYASKLPETHVLLQELFSPVRSASTEHGWNLILVNQDYQVPGDWDIELTELSNGQSVDSRIYPDLQQMFDDMRAQGVYPVVASGYRTAEKQQELMEEKIEELKEQGYSYLEAKAEARRWVSAVGHSEHQTGLAVDINADGVSSTGNQVYEWLEKNAWQYGFILRYPSDKENLTGTAYEPWHYRYVGKDAAEEIYRQGICLEEYILQLENPV